MHQSLLEKSIYCREHKTEYKTKKRRNNNKALIFCPKWYFCFLVFSLQLYCWLTFQSSENPDSHFSTYFQCPYSKFMALCSQNYLAYFFSPQLFSPGLVTTEP